MLKARFAALAGASILMFAGCGHAAVVPLDGSVTLAAPAVSYSVGPAGVASDSGTSQDLLPVDAAWGDPARLASSGAEPADAVSYALYVDTASAGNAMDTGTLLAGWSQGSLPASEYPLSAYLLGAGQFVLEVGTFASQQPVSTKVSPVPLPGATWLFGSGLLAFLWISARHRL